MDAIVSNQQRSCGFHRDEMDRVVISAMGGALLGGSIYAGIGAVIGGVLGAIAGAARNDEIKKLREKNNE